MIRKVFVVLVVLLLGLIPPAPVTKAESSNILTLPATRSSWTDTGLQVQSGNLIHIRASGKTATWPGRHEQCDANGECDRGIDHPSNRIHVSFVEMDSQARPPFRAGTNTSLVANRQGSVFLRVVDGWTPRRYSDNSGAYTVTVTVWRGNDRLGHDSAYEMARNAGINFWSTGDYVGPDRSRTDGTSLEEVWAEAIAGIIALKRACNCAVTITGGTKDGHATNLNYTYGEGWKLDTSANDEINDFIVNRSNRVGTGGGYPIYLDRATGYYYRDERSRPGAPHWDIQFNTNALSDLQS